MIGTRLAGAQAAGGSKIDLTVPLAQIIFSLAWAGPAPFLFYAGLSSTDGRSATVFNVFQP